MNKEDNYREDLELFQNSGKHSIKRKPKRVLLVGNHLSRAGQNISIGENLSKYIEKIGWATILVSTKKNRYTRLLDMLWTIISRRNDYAMAQIDVFSGLSFIWAYLSTKLINFFNKPVILTLHGGKLAEFAEVRTKQFKGLINSAEFITTPSYFLQDHFSKFRDDIIRIPNGIDLKRYLFRHRQQPGLRLIWLRALHKGDNSLEKVRALTDQCGLDGAVDIIGGVDKQDVPHWLNQGDIFINTTRYESFGVSVLEAAACGLPIVTTDAGELPYMWQDGVDALVVPVGDARAMAVAVERLLRNPELVQKLSMNARKKAEGYDWSLIMPQWETLFEELITQDL